LTIIYGLPGLYQNWLSASLDVNAKFVHQGNNFHTLHSAIPWVSKHQADYALEHDVINCYVSPSNLPWYLYNFFEKTDDIGINVDHWCSDIQRLGTDTIAYQGMLDHWQQSYNIANYQDQDYIKNSAVEYFYLFFIQPSPWRDLLEYQHPGSVNIEYGDFTSISMLRNKLSAMVHFDDDHFVQMYARLNASNYRYLSLPNQFKNKLAQLPFYTSFNVIDLAWLGALFYQIDHNRLDWFNPDTRHQTILQRYTELRCDQYNNNVNIQDL
jgi:hypothetical protein